MFIFVRNEKNKINELIAKLNEDGFVNIESVGLIFSLSQLDFEFVSYYEYNGELVRVEDVSEFCNKRFRAYYVGGQVGKERN